MRVLLLFLSLSCLAVLAAGLPSNPQDAACPSLPVTLELRPNTQDRSYSIVFASHDVDIKPDYVDIHYRVNNEDSVNLRALSQMSIADSRMRSTQTQVDGVVLHPGDVLRAFATYSSRGYECDTPIHTFNAPEESEVDVASLQRDTSPVLRVRMEDGREQFMTQAAVEEHLAQLANAESIRSAMSPDSACPAIDSVEEVLKQSGLRDTYVLSFENTQPLRQLEYVDLHVSNDMTRQEWDNLRILSNFNLELAHKVIQPGIVMKPNEAMRFYWSYRAVLPDGSKVDCSTPIRTVTAAQITHEVDLEQIKELARK